MFYIVITVKTFICNFQHMLNFFNKNTNSKGTYILQEVLVDDLNPALSKYKVFGAGTISIHRDVVER